MRSTRRVIVGFWTVPIAAAILAACTGARLAAQVKQEPANGQHGAPPASSAAAHLPAMPDGVQTRLDIVTAWNNDATADLDMVNLVAGAFFRGDSAAHASDEQSKQIREFARILRTFLISPSTTCIGLEKTKDHRVTYVMLEWPNPVDATLEFRRLVGLANALNARKENDAQLTSYSIGDQLVYRLALKRGGKPVAYVDALQHDARLFVAISSDAFRHVDRLANAQAAGARARFQSRHVDFKDELISTPRVEARPARLGDNPALCLIQDFQDLVISLQESAPVPAGGKIETSSTSAPLGPVAIASDGRSALHVSGTDAKAADEDRTTPATRPAPLELRDPQTRPIEPGDHPAQVAVPVPVPVPVPTATQPASDNAGDRDSGDLRALIGVNPGLKRADVTRFPVMSLRGFIRPRGGPPMALLEIAELNREFLVQEGTEIPVTVQGRVNPVGRSELTGLGGVNKQPGVPERPADAQGQSQIILKVKKVADEGVTVEAGLLEQQITVR